METEAFKKLMVLILCTEADLRCGSSPRSTSDAYVIICRPGVAYLFSNTIMSNYPGGVGIWVQGYLVFFSGNYFH